MSDRLLKESDVMRIAFQLPYVVNSAFFDAVKALPSADRSTGEPILCEDCKHKRTCAKTVNMTKIESNSITSWVQPLDFCSCGERREP